MNLETILNACLLAQYYIADCEKRPFSHYYRQIEAFRARILRMDAEKQFLLDEWERIVGGTPAGDVFRDNVREFENGT